MNKLFIAVTALFFTIVIGFFSYRHFTKQKYYELIEIYPDHNITKIKPHETSNNNSLASDNTIYDNFKTQKSSTRRVNLVPEPEQPINIVINNIIDAPKGNIMSSNIDPIDLILAEIAGSKQQSSNPSAIDTATPNLSNLANATSENKKLENFTHLDQNILPTKNGSKIREIEVVPITNNENYRNIKITKVVENNRLSDNFIKRDNSFKIQLASVKSETLGKLEGERIQKKFPKILGELNISVQKIEPKKNKVFYLVFAGSFANISKAKAACKKLSAKDQTCIVTR